MELVWFRVRGYRRFLDADAQLHGRLIALVGPNEAGKSSLLDALGRLNDTNAIEQLDISHGESYADSHPVLRARFLLNDEDRAAIAHLPGGSDVRWFILEKRRNGQLAAVTDPPISFDLAPRQSLMEPLNRLLRTKWGSGLPRSEAELGARLDVLAETLAKQDGYTEPERQEMSSLAELLGGEDVPKSGVNFGVQLAALLSTEPSEAPQVTARRALLGRRPLFLMFDQEHRDLRSEYDLATMNLDEPPVALQNVAKLAKLDLRRLLDWVQAGDYASPARPIEEANLALRTYFQESWTQSGVAVRLEHHETRLHVLISSPTGPYTSIRERSDGLREFVALATFVEVHGAEDRDIVLLIDEAETHLHYNAQADLIRVLDTQKAASAVIYSTHSAGCLPEDLGSTVRVVVRETDQWSRVQNSFWTAGPGFDPLLIGMGASALVFGAVRRAVVAEGATDLILLPSLLKEATGEEALGYQVAPGVAEVSGDAVADLELQAAKAVYLVDDDRGGREHAAKLRAAGIESGRILVLGDGIEAGYGLEDLVRNEFFLDAVNTELEISGREERMSLEQVPVKGRSAAVRKWCGSRGYSEPRKVNLASHMALNSRVEAPVLTSTGRKILIDLHARILASIGTPVA